MNDLERQFKQGLPMHVQPSADQLWNAANDPKEMMQMGRQALTALSFMPAFGAPSAVARGAAATHKGLQQFRNWGGISRANRELGQEIAGATKDFAHNFGVNTSWAGALGIGVGVGHFHPTMGVLKDYAKAPSPLQDMAHRVVYRKFPQQMPPPPAPPPPIREKLGFEGSNWDFFAEYVFGDKPSTGGEDFQRDYQEKKRSNRENFYTLSTAYGR